MKHLILICFFMTMPLIGYAETQSNISDKTQTINKDSNGNTKITMTGLDAVKLAGNLIDRGDYDHATQILTMMPITNSLSVELERWFLLAQMEQRKGNYEEAIKIYRKILDDQPDLARIRFELALCYMKTGRWYRADYHLRLAMAGKGLSDDTKQMMAYYRYIVRQNKRWNIWFNFGAAPDNNVNQASGGNECITNAWGTFCRHLPEPEKAIGTNFMLGGNYEFKLSDNWRWKSDATIYTNIYDKHKYDDLYLASSTGPRYVWEKGDVWLAGIINRRWYGWDRYNWAYGGKIDMNYDWSRKLSSGLTLRVMDNLYDEYGDWMDGQTYTAMPHITYSLDATKYVILRGNIERETAKVAAYANRKYGGSIGFGAELPYGFRVYLEPYFSWINYDGARWVVKDNTYQPIIERDFLQRYAVSLSNNKLEVKGFVPTITFSYTKKDSNIPAREYDKWTTEFTFQQRF